MHSLAEDEEELLLQQEGADEIDNEEEDHNEQDAQGQEDGEEEEEELLRQAIALSLEDDWEKSSWILMHSETLSQFQILYIYFLGHIKFH